MRHSHRRPRTSRTNTLSESLQSTHPESRREPHEQLHQSWLNAEAAVTLEQDNKGFRISRSALTLRASVPNLDQDTFARLAQDAEQNCPVSRVLRAEITLDAKLV